METAGNVKDNRADYTRNEDHTHKDVAKENFDKIKSELEGIQTRVNQIVNRLGDAPTADEVTDSATKAKAIADDLQAIINRKTI